MVGSAIGMRLYRPIILGVLQQQGSTAYHYIVTKPVILEILG
jgi:hypothetical protein